MYSVPSRSLLLKFSFRHQVLSFTIFFFFFFINLFIFAVLGLRFCVRAFSSCGKRGPPFIAVHGPLTIAASLVVEHRLQTRRLSNCGSRAQRSAACGIFPDEGSNPCPLHWQADSQTLRHQGSPMTLSELWFSQCICPVVGLLGHMVVLFLVF